MRASRSIVVGVDPSGEYAATLRVGMALAQETGAAMNVVTAKTGRAPAHAIRDAAVAHRAALIVIGRTRRGTFGHAENGTTFGRGAPGTTAERLLTGAGCPVVVVPESLEPDWALRRVGVGFVESDEGHEALAAGAVLAAAIDGSLAVRTIAASGSRGRDAAGTALRSALARHSLGAATGELLEGDRESTLVEWSGVLDLLVCGWSGDTDAVVFAGLARRLIREARCPVVMVPRGTGGALHELALPEALRSVP
jgi:nucleotide-binding universal stress UspA family protein